MNRLIDLMRIDLCVLFFVMLVLSGRTYSQDLSWEDFRMHASHAWKTYREQFDEISVAGGDETHRFELFRSRQTQTSVLVISYLEAETFLSVVKGNDWFFAVKKKNGEFFSTDPEVSSLDDSGREEFLRHIHRDIDRRLFPSLYIKNLSIEEVLECEELVIESVSKDPDQPEKITLELVIDEHRFRIHNPQQVARIKVTFNSEKLWTITEYHVSFSSGNEASYRHETAGFRGCSIAAKTHWIDSLNGIASLSSITTREFSLTTNSIVEEQANKLLEKIVTDDRF